MLEMVLLFPLLALIRAVATVESSSDDSKQQYARGPVKKKAKTRHPG
jgi:hypothetical protein